MSMVSREGTRRALRLAARQFRLPRARVLRPRGRFQAVEHVLRLMGANSEDTSFAAFCNSAK